VQRSYRIVGTVAGLQIPTITLINSWVSFILAGGKRKEKVENKFITLHGSYHSKVWAACTLKRTNAAEPAVLVLFPTTWTL
jgi:hypothetical protein